ncbi:DUF2793 domain-containing protein [Bradyrhizobium sp.]|jgi:hypothetical protein|uniref:DUF2793 domain-containing protein n=1 Tax=Bradyrhizobium sp. TaxID=376 RepID=UPI002E05B0EA|nr:DUF2793 domain-containing protein [Bradyrhizobium sp.]
MTDTPNLGLPFIEGSQAQKHVTHNEALRILDAAIQVAVLDLTRTSPPPSPAEGERHVVAAGATGAWAGHGNAIATWQDGAWAFLVPKSGWCIWSAADDVMFVFDGTHWRDLRDLPVTLDNAVHVGINTTASSPNLLSVKSNAALLSAIAVTDGGSGDARLQISKESAAKTASVVFSDAFSGRAEFGLAGSDAFKLKVSANGSAWVEAFSVDQGTGNLALPRGLALAGVISPPQITANQNDYNPAGAAAATVLQLSSDALRTVSGLAGGAEGRVVNLVNIGSQPILLSDESTSSSAANRFALGANLTLAAKQAAMLRYDGSATRWRLIAGATGLLVAANNLSDLASTAVARANLGVREQLTANRTYYVRTDGSDGNSGLANSSGGAFLSIQKAIDTVAALDLSIWNVTIQAADGTYAGAVMVSGPWVGSGTVTLQGNTSTPANALLSTGATDCITVVSGGMLTVTGFKLTNSGAFLLHASSGSIRFSTLTFGTCGSQQVRATDGGRIVASGNYAIDGGAGNHWSALGNGIVRVQGRTITLTGTPAFSLAFANADLGSTVLVNGNTFSGAATGVRYSATNNAAISSGGAGATYLPGNAAGSTSAGGQYI